jgi:hypothetical protein
MFHRTQSIEVIQRICPGFEIPVLGHAYQFCHAQIISPGDLKQVHGIVG